VYLMSIERSVTNQNETKEKNQGYYKDTIIAFFKELLGFVGQIRKVYREAHNQYITLQHKAQCMEVNVKDKSFAEQIMNFFLVFSLDNPERSQEYVTICARQSMNEEEVFSSYKKGNDFKVKSCVATDLLRLEKTMNTLDYVFLEKNTRERLKKHIRDIKLFYLQRENNKCLWEQKEIFQFLNIYYEILRLLLCEEGVLQTEGVTENLLIPMLNLGVEWNEEGNCAQVCMTSPIVLSALNMIYDRINQFVLLDVQDSTQECIFSEIFLSKIHQIFRYHLIKDKNGELYHVALSAYKTEELENELSVSVRSMQTYNSYQGIRELRLADKILYELKQRKDVLEVKEYNIVVVGEIDRLPMWELLQYLNKVFKYKEEFAHVQKLKLKFHIYTRSACDMQNIAYGNFECEFCEYVDQLLNIRELDRMLESGDLFFLLDHCHLYREEIEEIDNFFVFKQFISSDTYEEYYNKNLARDLTLECKFMDLYNVLTMYVWKEHFGFFKKKARNAVVDYIRNIINCSDDKIAYIYISDIAAFKDFDCARKYMVRIEEYNQKEVGIIRLTNQDNDILPITFETQVDIRNKKILVFNVWQFVKHAVLNQREYFEQQFLKNPSKQFLNDVLIGLDYSNWQKEIKVSYFYQDKNRINCQELEEFIPIILKEIFKADSDMYSRYLKKSVISFLYGSAKSVEDLLFVYILQYADIREDLFNFGHHGDTDFYNPEIEFYYRQNCKYSYKKLYWDVFERFDTGSFNFIDRYIIQESVKQYGDFTDCKGFMKGILQATHNMEYSSSRIYKNCIEMIEKN